MAKRKQSQKRAAKKVAPKKPTAKKVVSGKQAAKKVARKAAPRRPAKRATASTPAMPKPRPGVITHTELASADPPATLAWCASVLGWQFGEAMPTPTGPYYMWRFSNDTGGGIRNIQGPEVPGSIPYCEVTSIRDTFSRALEGGATEMLAPMALPGGMGWIAIVAAPGGVPIGFWSMK